MLLQEKELNKRFTREKGNDRRLNSEGDSQQLVFDQITAKRLKFHQSSLYFRLISKCYPHVAASIAVHSWSCAVVSSNWLFLTDFIFSHWDRNACLLTHYVMYSRSMLMMMMIEKNNLLRVFTGHSVCNLVSSYPLKWPSSSSGSALHTLIYRLMYLNRVLVWLYSFPQWLVCMVNILHASDSSTNSGSENRCHGLVENVTGWNVTRSDMNTTENASVSQFMFFLT